MQRAGPGLLIKIIVNIALISAFPLGLKVYEVKQINKLKAQRQREELLLSQINQQLSALKAELDSYGYLTKKSAEFAKKKEFLSQLTEERLITPRILEFIQDNLPNTVWLKKIQVDISNKESKRVEISGESFKEVSVNVFASSLEQVLDGNSITVNMRDVKE
ncbi:MAG: PilN domain-containing protein, partial [Oligoflexia bacterium]|nr:PilN domain-containing protein [Oligoflexia bacterium]